MSSFKSLKSLLEFDTINSEMYDEVVSIYIFCVRVYVKVLHVLILTVKNLFI